MRILILLASALVLAASASAQNDAWVPFAEADVVQIITTDADGDTRKTKVWLVVVDGSGYVRTNDSRWLANIRRGSAVSLRADDEEIEATSTEVVDVITQERVELAFKTKYGAMQKFMSCFRISEPTTLRLDVNTSATPTTGAISG